MNRTATLLLAVAFLSALVAAAWLWLWPRAEPLAAPQVAESPRSTRPSTAEPRSGPDSSPAAVAPATREPATAEADGLPPAAADEITGQVIRPGDIPVRGARVTVRPEPGGFAVDGLPTMPGPAASDLITTTTDDRGRFACQRIPNTTWYMVRAEAPGYVPSQVRATAGREVLIRLEPSACLYGTVTDADQQPVAYATLFVEWPIRGDQHVPRPPQEVTASTWGDELGGYELEPVPRGIARLLIVAPRAVPVSRTIRLREPQDYQLDIQLERMLPVRCEVRDASSQTPIAGAVVLRQVPDPLARSDAAGRFVLRVPVAGPTPVRIEAPGYAPIVHTFAVQPGEAEQTATILLVRGARIRGRVQDPAGNPVAGARLSLERETLVASHAADRERAARKVLPALAPSSVFVDMDGAAAPVSGADGRFEITGLVGRRAVLHVRVRADCTGWCTAWSETLDLDPPAVEANVLLTMGRGGVIEGRLLRDGLPVAGQVLAIAQGLISVPTDPDGGFVLPLLPPGRIRLSGNDGAARNWSGSVDVVVIEGGRVRADIELQARPETGDRLVIAGRVHDADGQPRQGVVVSCAQDDPDGDPSAGIRAPSDAEGSWQVRVLPDPRKAATWTVSTLVNGVRRGHLRVRPPCRDVELTLPATVDVRLEVTCADGRTPEEITALVRDVDGGRWQSYAASPKAHATALKPIDTLALPAGTFDLRVKVQGYVPTEFRGIQVTAPGRPTLRVVAQPGASLALDLAGEAEALQHRSLFLVHADEELEPGPTVGVLLARSLEGARIRGLFLDDGKLSGQRISPGRHRLVSEDREITFDPEWVEVGEQPVRGRVHVALRR